MDRSFYRARIAAAALAWLAGCHGGPDTAAPERAARTLEKAPWPVTAFVVPNVEQAVASEAVASGSESEHDAESKKLSFPNATNPKGHFPAQIYGDLDAGACLRELSRRAIPFVRVGRARGVETPIRLKGRLHGVDIHGDRPRERDRSPYEIVDCRLALALDDFSALLSAHGVVDAQHMSIYRPPTKPLEPGKKRGQHEAGLAMDLGILTRADGSRIVIEDDFRGKIGAKTCGEGAGPNPVTEDATELREILCTAVGAQTFNVYLTPNHDTPHHNHFHLEVMRHVKWILVE